MKEFHEDGELATRDLVARAIHSVMRKDNRSEVFLDLRPIGCELLCRQFPTIVATLNQYGLDPVSTPIPVSPAAHYFMGGILTDINGNTSVAGLSAIGECASVGLHGANRLASNSLLEAGVMALRTVGHLVAVKQQSLPRPHLIQFDKLCKVPAPDLIPHSVERLREAMYANVGLIRDERSLKMMLRFLSKSSITMTLSDLKKSTVVEAANLQTLALLITSSALQRNESRGSHFRSDFQLPNDRLFAKRLTVCQSQYSWLNVETSLKNNWQSVSTPLSAAGT